MQNAEVRVLYEQNDWTRPRILKIRKDGQYVIETPASASRMVIGFDEPLRLSSVYIRTAVKPTKIRLVAFASSTDQYSETSVSFQSYVVEGDDGFSVSLKSKERWNEVIFEFPAQTRDLYLKPSVTPAYDVKLPSLSKCFKDFVSLGEDFTFLCNDGHEVKMSSVLVKATCETIRANWSQFEEANHTIDLSTCADWKGFDSAAMLAVKEILMTRKVCLSVLRNEPLGLEVVRLMYYLLVVGKEKIWRVFCDALPLFSSEYHMRIMESAGDHCDAETVLACATLVTTQYGRDQSQSSVVKMEAVMAKLQESIGLFTVNDPQAFIACLQPKVAK